jgi:D-glycero-beta-D-manno-heptose-7-phosphate kinase
VVVQTSNSIREAFDSLHQTHVLVVGDLVLDSYVFGQTTRLSREAPVVVVRKEREEFRLGGAANTAANIAALGAKVTLVGIVGQDDAGNTLCDLLHECGVNFHPLRQSSWTTPLKTRVLAGAAGTGRQQVLRIDTEPKEALGYDVLDALSQTLEKVASDASITIVSDYGLGSIQGALLETIHGLGEKGHPLCVDSRSALAGFRSMQAATPNVPEAEALVGFRIDTEESQLAAGHKLLDMLDTQSVLLTLGRGGMALFQPGFELDRIGVVGAAEVTDVTGAGDTVIATFSTCIAAGLGLHNSMRLANCAASVVVGKLGAASATPQEILSIARQCDLELQPWGK